jgi:hypothetical protein
MVFRQVACVGRLLPRGRTLAMVNVRRIKPSPTCSGPPHLWAYLDSANLLRSPSTEAPAGKCGGDPCRLYRTASSPVAGWLGLADWPFHSGCEVPPALGTPILLSPSGRERVRPTITPSPSKARERVKEDLRRQAGASSEGSESDEKDSASSASGASVRGESSSSRGSWWLRWEVGSSGSGSVVMAKSRRESTLVDGQNCTSGAGPCNNSLVEISSIRERSGLRVLLCRETCLAQGKGPQERPTGCQLLGHSSALQKGLPGQFRALRDLVAVSATPSLGLECPFVPLPYAQRAHKC